MKLGLVQIIIIGCVGCGGVVANPEPPPDAAGTETSETAPDAGTLVIPPLPADASLRDAAVTTCVEEHPALCPSGAPITVPVGLCFPQGPSGARDTPPECACAYTCDCVIAGLAHYCEFGVACAPLDSGALFAACKGVRVR